MFGDGDRASLFAALAACQAEVRNPAFDARGHHQNQYATLQQHLTTLRPVLARHGLCLTQLISTMENRIVVRTVLGHVNGGWIGSEAAVPMGDDIQKMAGKITYLRRYMVSAITGVAGDHDDDGEGPERPKEGAQKAGKPAKAPKGSEGLGSFAEAFRVESVQQRTSKAGKAFYAIDLIDKLGVVVPATTFSESIGTALSKAIGSEVRAVLEPKESNGKQYFNIREIG